MRGAAGEIAAGGICRPRSAGRRPARRRSWWRRPGSPTAASAGGSAAQAASESAIRAGARAAASSRLAIGTRRARGEACIGIILGGAASSGVLGLDAATAHVKEAPTSARVPAAAGRSPATIAGAITVLKTSKSKNDPTARGPAQQAKTLRGQEDQAGALCRHRGRPWPLHSGAGRERQDDPGPRRQADAVPGALSNGRRQASN